MILSNVELHKALDEGRLVIEPEPSPRFPSLGKDCPFDTHSIDLSLAPELSVPKDDLPFAYDLSKKKKLSELIASGSEKHVIQPNAPYQLKQGKFILGRTIERVSLPIFEDGRPCLAARIEGKSSRARIGLLVHFTAPTVHPGWDGTLTLEMINLGPAPILLHAGVPIAQLIVEEVSGVPVANPSQFQGQKTLEGT